MLDWTGLTELTTRDYIPLLLVSMTKVLRFIEFFITVLFVVLKLLNILVFFDFQSSEILIDIRVSKCSTADFSCYGALNFQTLFLFFVVKTSIFST